MTDVLRATRASGRIKQPKISSQQDVELQEALGHAAPKEIDSECQRSVEKIMGFMARVWQLGEPALKPTLAPVLSETLAAPRTLISVWKGRLAWKDLSSGWLGGKSQMLVATAFG